jgi:hypothetical protein
MPETLLQIANPDITGLLAGRLLIVWNLLLRLAKQNVWENMFPVRIKNEIYDCPEKWL